MSFVEFFEFPKRVENSSDVEFWNLKRILGISVGLGLFRKFEFAARSNGPRVLEHRAKARSSSRTGLRLRSAAMTRISVF